MRPQLPLNIDDFNEPEPDIALVRSDLFEHPRPWETLLVIEVSDTTYKLDAGPKARIYARCGIPEFWIVNVRARRIEVYGQPSAEGYAERHSAAPGDTLAVGAFPDVTIPVEVLFQKP